MRRPRLSYANVMATLALFVALGGVGYAAVKLPKDSVRSKQIKEDAVKASELAPDSVDGSHITSAGVGGDEIANGSVDGGDIGDFAVGSVQLAEGAVTEAKLDTPASFTSAGLPDAFGTCAGVGDSWGSFSPDVNNSVEYYRDPTGIVHLRGIAVRCGAAGGTIFTLPAGYRPGKQEIHAAWSSGANAVRLQIQGNGVVEPLPAAIVPAGSWLSLDGITFRCAPPGDNDCPPSSN
jgi:hypothetical protein